MFRLMFLLCATIFVTMLIGGQDRGQTRFGLLAIPEAPQPVVVAEAVAPVAPKAVVPAAYVPQAPVMVTPAVQVAEAALPMPAPAGRLLYVNSRSANVRSGPGKDHDVIASLPRGEAVLVVVEAETLDGWALVRIEGDGVEGYVAARLLTE